MTNTSRGGAPKHDGNSSRNGVLLKPPPPVTTAEAEAARKAREEFGTQGPSAH
jgi:hypothetical protein